MMSISAKFHRNPSTKYDASHEIGVSGQDWMDGRTLNGRMTRKHIMPLPFIVSRGDIIT